jgi:hypothetical protein
MRALALCMTKQLQIAYRRLVAALSRERLTLLRQRSLGLRSLRQERVVAGLVRTIQKIEHQE